MSNSTQIEVDSKQLSHENLKLREKLQECEKILFILNQELAACTGCPMVYGMDACMNSGIPCVKRNILNKSHKLFGELNNGD